MSNGPNQLKSGKNDESLSSVPTRAWSNCKHTRVKTKYKDSENLCPQTRINYYKREWRKTARGNFFTLERGMVMGGEDPSSGLFRSAAGWPALGLAGWIAAAVGFMLSLPGIRSGRNGNERTPARGRSVLPHSHRDSRDDGSHSLVLVQKQPGLFSSLWRHRIRKAGLFSSLWRHQIRKPGLF